MKNGHADSRFYRNFKHVAKANILAQGLHLLALPLYSYLYLPAAFGAFAIFSATLAIVASVSTWKFDWLIPNTDSSAAASALMCLGGLLAAMFGSVAFFTSDFWLPWLSTELELSQLGYVPLCLLVAILLTSASQLLQALYVKRADLAQVSRAKLAQSVSTITLALILGGAGFQASGLIISLIGGSFVGVAILALGLRPEICAVRSVNGELARAVLKRYRYQATVSTAISFVNNLSFSVVPFLIGISFGVVEAGLYAMANRLVIAPLALVTQSLGQSFWAEAGQLVKGEIQQLMRLYRRTTFRLLVIACPLSLLCLLGANLVHVVITEPEWQDLRIIIPAFIPMAVGTLIFSSTNHIIVFNKKHYQLVVDAIRLGATCGLILWANELGLGFFHTIFLVGLASFSSHFMLFLIHLAVHHSALKRISAGVA